MTVIFLFMIQSPPNFIPAPDTATCADGYFFHFHLPRILISWAGLYNSYHPLFSFSNNFSNLALRTLLTWLLWSTCCWLPGLVASLTYLEFRWQFNLRDFAIIFVLPFSIYNLLHSNSQIGPRTNPGKHKKIVICLLSFESGPPSCLVPVLHLSIRSSRAMFNVHSILATSQLR